MTWQHTCSFVLENNMSISDSSYFFDNPVIVPMIPGTYEASARVEKMDGSPFVASYRVQLSGQHPIDSKPAGEVLVDFGQIMVCDRARMERAFDHLGDDGMQTFYGQLDTTELTAVVQFDDGTTAPIFRPGFGDGRYRIFELTDSDGRPIGIEIDCEHPI